MSPLTSTIRLQPVVDNATLPIVLCGPDGDLLYSNPPADALLGGLESSWLKRQWDHLKPWLQDPRGTRSLLLRAGRDKVLPVEVAVAPLKIGETNNYLFFLYDLSEHHLYRRQLSAARDRLKLLSEHLVHAQEGERSHFAREIHDGLLQHIVGANIVLDKVRSGKDDSLLELVARRLEGATVEARRLIGELRPPTLEDFGLGETLAATLRRLSQESGISFELTFDLSEHEIPEALKTNLFRMVQEATNNVARHSEADRAEVVVRRDGDALRVRVQDNGKGFGPDHRPGVGMSSLEERASLFGGYLQTTSEPGNTVVEVTLPFPSADLVFDSQRKSSDILPSFFSRLRRDAEARLESPAPLHSLSLSEEELKALTHEMQVYQIEMEMQNEELRRSQNSLEHERDRYRELFEQSPTGYLHLDSDYQVYRANRVARELLELPDDLSGIGLTSLVTPGSRDTLEKLLERGSGQAQVSMKRKDGATPFPALLELRGYQEDSTSLAIITDLTERERRRDLEKEVAFLRGHRELDALSEEKGGLDLNEELSLLVESLRDLVPENKLEFRPGAALPRVKMDRTALRMVATNLVRNAAEALGQEAGVITLSSGSVVSAQGQADDFVSLDVSDTGFGTDSEMMNRAFEAFSKKGDNRELRLCEVLYLVRRRCGDVHLLSEPTRGTTVRVLLPCTQRLE